MFKNYFKVAFRNLIKNKLNSSINIFGLTVAIAASIVIFLFANNELTYNANHKNAKSIYLVYKERITPTGTQITRDTWLPMAEALRNDYPSIINATRVWVDDASVQYGTKRFEENVTYADPGLFEMFTLPLKESDPSIFSSDIHSVVISQEIARKYFGTDNPIGKSMTIDYTTDYIVRGVLDEIPQTSSVQIDIMAPAESVSFYEENKENWDGSFLSTFIQLSEGSTLAALQSQFPAFVTKIWGAELNKSMNLKLTPLLDLYHQLTGANTYAYILIGIAVVILVIASINFMNLATARSLERAREIGMRKALGASRIQLIRQYLSESLIMSGIALVLGIGVAEFFLPAFNAWYDMSLELDYLNNISTLFALIGLGLIVGVFSGSYPAFFLSRFQPSESLQGKLKSSPTGLRLRNGLVVTQFSLSIILIIGTGIILKQLRYMKDANLNFSKENIIAIPAELSDFENREQAQVRLETLKNELRQNANILSVSSSSHVPGRWPEWFRFAYPTDREDSQRLRMRESYVDAHYFKTFGIEFVEGRDFSEELATDAQASMVINKAALRHIGWPSGQGRQIRVGNTVYNVIGVVRDYHYQSLAAKIAPVLHFYRPPDNGFQNFISVRITSQYMSSTLDYIGKQWQNVDPTRAFEFFFVDENFNRLYESENRLAAVAGSFTILAIIVSCLGLFALASLMITHRTKEIGVRKVLGASVSNIVYQLSKDFTKFVLVAFVIACPIAYFAMNKWLQDFAYRIDILWWVFALAGGLVLVIVLLTVSTQAIRAALANPVESLRYE